MILYWTESVSAVYYPAENVEIVNTVLSPIHTWAHLALATHHSETQISYVSLTTL